MQYDALPDDERGRLLDFARNYRATMREINRVFGRLERLEDAWSGGIAAIVAKLDDGTVASPSSDLVGAAPVLKESMVGTMTDFGQAMGLFYGPTNRQSYIGAAGLSATMEG